MQKGSEMPVYISPEASETAIALTHEIDLLFKERLAEYGIALRVVPRAQRKSIDILAKMVQLAINKHHERCWGELTAAVKSAPLTVQESAK